MPDRRATVFGGYAVRVPTSLADQARSCGRRGKRTDDEQDNKHGISSQRDVAHHQSRNRHPVARKLRWQHLRMAQGQVTGDDRDSRLDGAACASAERQH